MIFLFIKQIMFYIIHFKTNNKIGYVFTKYIWSIIKKNCKFVRLM